MPNAVVVVVVVEVVVVLPLGVEGPEPMRALIGAVFAAGAGRIATAGAAYEVPDAGRIATLP